MSASKKQEALIRGFIRRAIRTDAPLLAAGLHRYADAEGLEWEELASSLGCSVEALDQVALCRPPREEQFAADVAAIAGEHVDPARLLPLLRRLQVLEVLGEAPAPSATPVTHRGSSTATPVFLAARVREEDADYGDDDADKPRPADEELEIPAEGEPGAAHDEPEGGRDA